jgi:hypothetical protein
MKAADFCFEFSPLTKGLHRIATQIWKALKSAGELPRGCKKKCLLTESTP